MSARTLFHGQLHIGALVVRREWRRLAPERGVRLDGELIGRDVRRAGARRLANVGARHVDALPRQAVHQVDVDVVECRERRRDGAPGLVCGMNAPERAQHAIVEALHADGDAIHAGVAEATETARLHRPGIRLERDFRAGLERQARAHAGEQCVDRFRREQAGRAAADEHARKAPTPDRRQLAFEVEQQLLDVRLFRQRARALVGIEVAIRALAHAPRDVDVERERRQGLQAHAVRPLNLRGFHSTTLSAWRARCPGG